MKYKTIMGSALLGLTIILLTVSGSVIQAEITSTQTQNTISAVSMFIEDMKIVAGNDAAALVELVLIGEDVPDISKSTLFNEVNNWLFIASDQDNYLPYLVRRPLKAPENATLVLDIDSSLGGGGSLARALDIASMFAIEYGVSLMWSRVDVLPSGDFLYYFTGGMTNTIFNTLITEFQTDITSGYASLLNGATVGAAPVKAVLMGEGFIEGASRAVRAVYYVDDGAITGTSTEYILSTDTLFGTPVSSYIGLIERKFSILKFRFPYTINTISISPRTDNFAPHITGKMDWILKAPWLEIPKPTQDYVVTFNTNHTRLLSTPRVSVNMAYDQDMLNSIGRLQMDYVVNNTGDEAAKNIDIYYPLGPDFQTLLDNKPNMTSLKPDFYIDPTEIITISGTVTIDVDGSLESIYPDQTYTQEVLILEGWYKWLINDSLVDFDTALTNTVVKSDSEYVEIMGYSGNVVATISLSCPDGLSLILVDEVTTTLAPINIIDYASSEKIDELFSDYEDAIKAGVAAAGFDLKVLLYEEKTIFNPDWMDFETSFRKVGELGSETLSHTEYFLNSTILSLPAHTATTVSWAIDDIPAQDDHFGIMGYEFIDVGASYDALKLTTVNKTGYDLMRYLFAIKDPGPDYTYSRPLSFFEPVKGLYISAGARFSYQDDYNFEYFGFSNGINLQLADNEAVLNVNVALDSTSYVVGGAVRVYYSIENTGNSPATDVVVRLYHGRMGNNWQIQNPEEFWTDTGITVAAGETYSTHADVNANSFLGIHPVYAVVEFKSDVGDTTDVNFGPGIDGVFEGAGETHELVISNMDWAMLLPDSEDRRPAFPQPIIQIDVEVNFIIPEDAPWELELTITITNVGEVDTTIIVIQFYNATEMDLLSRSTTKGNDFNTTVHGMGIILFTGITLGPGHNVIISMRWLFLYSHGCYIPGIIVVYTSIYENELDGDDGDVQPETDTELPLMQALDGQSQDNDDWEDYGQSTQTGTSAGADVFAGEHTRRMGGLDALYWSLGAIFVTAVATTMKKKFKK